MAEILDAHFAQLDDIAVSQLLLLNRITVDQDLILAAEIANPSFVALNPSLSHLYAVTEIDDYEGNVSGALSSFDVDRSSGALTFLNRQPTNGPGPCHVNIDAAGKNAVTHVGKLYNIAAGRISNSARTISEIRLDGSLPVPKVLIMTETGSATPMA